MASIDIYSLVLIISGTVSGILATTLAVKFEGVGRYAAYLMFWSALWALCSGVGHMQEETDRVFLVACIKYIAITLYPAYWIIFILKFLKKDSILEPLNVALLFVIPVGALLLVWTNPWHHLFFRDIVIEVVGQVAFARFLKGPVFIIHTIYFYCCLIIGVGLLMKKMERKDSVLSKQKKLILLAVVIPWISNTLFLSGVYPRPGVDFTPIAFIITTILLAWGIFKYQLFDIMPIARERIIEALQEGVMVLDEKDRIIFLNKEMGLLLSKSATEVFGLPVCSFFPSLRHSLAGNAEVEIVLCMRNKKRTFSVTISNFQDNHSTKEGRILLFKDISDRKEAEIKLRDAKEEAEQAVGEKARFLSTMSHEIRTPLNAILGYTHLLMQNSPREDQMECLKVQKFSSENLLAIINDILDFSKIEAGKIILEETDVDVAQLLKNILLSFRPTAEEKGIALELYVDDELPVVLGDPVRMSQVFTNLIGNAVKFTTKGKVSLHAKLLKKEEVETRILFEVRDTGIGIPADKIDHIFESFAQASSDTTRNFGGTGLGLTITRHLLKLMNSDIQVRSEVGSGSRFFFEIKLKNSASHIEENGLGQILEGGLKGKRVLIVDDNPVNVMLVKQFLKKWEMNFGSSSNGREALGEIQNSAYDLVLMDLQMPDMDGYEATKHIRKLSEPGFDRIPIIALSASAISEVKTEVLNAGMNDIITKPFSPDDLYRKMRAHLN